jgi:hypothetical protein
MSAETQLETGYAAQQALYDRLNAQASTMWMEFGEALVADLRSIVSPAVGDAKYTNEGRAATAHLGDGVCLHLLWSDVGRELQCSADLWMLHDVPAEDSEGLRVPLLLLALGVGRKCEAAGTSLSSDTRGAHVRKKAELLRRAAERLRPLLPAEAASAEPGAPT